MKAVKVNEKTSTLFIDEVETPSIGKNEVLVQVKATALNRADLLQKRGLYPPPPGASHVLGLEMSGVIEKIGENVTQFQIGDRVCALLSGGGYAEYVAVPEEMLIPIPDSLGFEEAAAIPEAFLTAYLNLFHLGKLQKDQTVLIHAGASGVGTAAIQLATLAGAKVIVTAGSEEKLELCRSLGANLTINYRNGEFQPIVYEWTEYKGAHLILDFIGASYWEQNISSLAVDGKLILIGTLGGTKIKETDLGKILFRRIQVIGSTLRSLPIEKKSSLTKDFVSFAYEQIANGHIKPIIDSVYDWTDVNDAHERMERNLNSGKIVLTVS